MRAYARPLYGWAGELVSASTGWAGRLIHYVIDDSPSPPTLQLEVGRSLHEHRRAGGPFVSSTRDRGRGDPLSRSGQLAEVNVTSGG